MRRKKILIKLIIYTLMICGSGITGFQLASREPRIVEKPVETDDAILVGANDSRISSKTKLNISTKYEMCSHTIFEQSYASKDMQGLTFTEFEAQYPSLKIQEFDASSIVAKNAFSCYCPQHFILKKEGNKLAVFRTIPGKDEQEIFLETNVNFNRIDEDEKQVLLIGKVFNDRDELDIYLEKITNSG